MPCLAPISQPQDVLTWLPPFCNIQVRTKPTARTPIHAPSYYAWTLAFILPGPQVRSVLAGWPEMPQGFRTAGAPTMMSPTLWSALLLGLYMAPCLTWAMG